MVPLLFKKTLTATEAQNEIIGGLVESLGCSVTEERNGIYELELKYPSNGSLLSELKIGNYILAKVRTQTSYNKQEFRIYEVTKPINGVVTVRCEHTSYLLNTYPVWKLEKGGYNVGTVMNYIFNSAHYYRPSDKPFLFSSPISESWVWKTPFELDTTNIRSAIGEVLNFFGGEIEFDNYQTKLHQNRGIERSLVIEYGINMTEFTCTEKLENYYTHFIPYVTYGDESPRFMSGDKKVMVLENPLNTEPRVLLQDITSLFTIDSPEQFSTLTDEEIQSSAEVFLENNKINEPSLNIDVSFVKINSTKISQEERDILEGLEDVNLCDTITIRHVPYGLEVKGKIIKTVFDVLRERYISLEIGTSKEDMGTVGKNALAGVTGYVNSVVNGQSEAAEVINQRVREDLERLGKDISASYGGYISFTTDANKNYTQMIISDRVNGTRDPRAEGATGWIFSQNGLAHGTFDKYGNLTNIKVAINRDGTLAGENIVGYHVTASDITTGTISSPITEGNYAFFDVGRGVLASHKIVGSDSYETQLNGSQLKQLFNGSVRGGTGMTSSGRPFLVYVRSQTDGYGVGSVENDGDGNLDEIALFSNDGIDFYKKVNFYVGIGELSVNKLSVVDSSQTTKASINTNGSISCTGLSVNGQTPLYSIPSSLNVSSIDTHSVHFDGRGSNSYIAGNNNRTHLNIHDSNSIWFTGNGTQMWIDGDGVHLPVVHANGTAAIGTTRNPFYQITSQYNFLSDGSSPLCYIRWYNQTGSRGCFIAPALDSSGTFGQSFWFHHDSNIATGSKYFLRPSSGGFALGSGSYRWDNIFSSNSNASSSDRNLKDNIKPMPNNYEEIFDDLKPVIFSHKNGDRTHMGFIAQDIEETIHRNGLTSTDFAALCIDKNDNPDLEMENIYSLRYADFVPLCVYKIQILNRKIEELERRLQND